MARASFTGAQLDWLAQEYRRHQIPELTRRYNLRWGQALTEGQVRSAVANHGMRSGRATRRTFQISYTPAEVAWLARWYPRVDRARLAQLFWERFGRRVQPGALAQRCRAYAIRAGRDGRFRPGAPPWNAGLAGYQQGGRSPETRFRAGHHPRNTAPIGTYRQDQAGMWLVKVSDRDPARAAASNARLRDWRMVHRLTWEGEHGPVPPRHVVILIDGDPDHCLDLSNVACVSRSELARLNQAGFSRLPPDRDLRRVAIAQARLVTAAHRRARDLGLGAKERARLLPAAGNFPPRSAAAAERSASSHFQPGADPRRAKTGSDK